MHRLLAYLWMASKTSALPKPKSSQSDVTIKIGRDSEFEAIEFDKTPGEKSPGSEHIDSIQRSTSEEADSSRSTVTTTRDLPGTGFRANASSTRWVEERTEGSGEHTHTRTIQRPAVFELSQRDKRRWYLAREAMDMYDLDKPNQTLDLVTIQSIPEQLENPYKTKSDSTRSFWGSLGVAFVSACYGGLHVLAWNAHFPTHRELKLWRAATLIIVIPPLSVFVIVAAGCLVAVPLALSRVLKYPRSSRQKTASTSTSTANDSAPNSKSVDQSQIPAASSGEHSRQQQAESQFWQAAKWVGKGLELVLEVFGPIVIGFLYFPARVYLVYESLRTVFDLPPEAYKSTNWTQYLPHIS